MKNVGYESARRHAATRSDGAAALYGGTIHILIDFIGQLMVAELISLVGLLTVNVRKLISRIPELRYILIGYSIFLCALILSDVYNGSAPTDYLRGWASIVFAMISTTFLTAHLLRSSRAALFFLAALCLAGLVFREGDLDLSMVQENSNYFKVRFIPVLYPGLILAACLLWNFRRIFSVAVLILGGLVFIAFDARSSGASLFLSGCLLLAQLLRLRPNLPQIIFVGLGLCLVAYGSYIYYVNQVLHHGLGGGHAQQLRLLENPYNPLELLFVGRSGFFVAKEAISERPLLGFGSWARDTSGRYEDLRASIKGYYNTEAYELDIIPAHSVILTAWLWAGVGGFIGIGIVWVTMVRLFVSNFWAFSPLAPALCALFVGDCWDILFSPIAVIRVGFPFTIAILIAGACNARSVLGSAMPRRRSIGRVQVSQ